MARRHSGRRRHRESAFHRGEISGDLIGRSTAQTVAALREIGEHVINAAKSELANGVALIVEDAKSRCPVKTGKLRDSIEAVAERGGAVYELSANAHNRDGIAYGQFVEFSPKINQPFLYPAMDENAQFVLYRIKSAIKQAIDRGH